MMTTEMSDVKKNSKEYTFCPILTAASFPFLVNTSWKIGIKHPLKAPSAKIFLKKFEILIATNKESVVADAPKKKAIKIERKNPVMRENKVKMLTVDNNLKRFIWLFY